MKKEEFNVKIKAEDLDRLCWHCNTKLLYGGEHDISQEDEFYDSVTYMGCPECGTHVEIYKAKKNIDSYEAKSNAIH
jgi:RNase P subunit RPR2